VPEGGVVERDAAGRPTGLLQEQAQALVRALVYPYPQAELVEAIGKGLGADPQAVYPRWAEFTSWAAGQGSEGAEPYDAARLRAPAPAPRQSFGIGLNYRDHAAESGIAVPEQPSVFTKFPSCITGPYGDVVLPPGGHTDWEVELVAVIGTEARHVAEADGWSHVAGLCVGQDISERITQLAGAAPQFSMGKSFPGFGPTGPWLVTPDEFADPDDLVGLGAFIGEFALERNQIGLRQKADRVGAHVDQRVRKCCAGPHPGCRIVLYDIAFRPRSRKQRASRQHRCDNKRK